MLNNKPAVILQRLVKWREQCSALEKKTVYRESKNDNVIYNQKFPGQLHSAP